MRAPARRLPAEPRVDGTEGKRPVFGAPPRVGHVIEEPANLRSGKIRVDHEASALAHGRLETRSLQLVAERGGSPALPHDGVMDGTARRALPHHRGPAP